jgi:ribonuclease P protein component
MKHTFRAHERLRRRTDFLRARREGRKRVGRLLVVWVFRRRDAPPRASRLGIMVSRRDGGAVQRNLFKRRVREAFRLGKHAAPRGWDILAAPKRQTAFPPEYAPLREEFWELVRQSTK